MAVFKRGKVWYYKFQIKGVPYYRSIPEARTKKQAEQAEVKVKTEVFEGRYGRATGEGCFMDYAESVYLPWAKEHKLSWKGDKYTITAGLKPFFGRMSFRQITPMVLERFKRQRLATPTIRKTETSAGKDRKPASVNRELALISRIFSMAIRDGLTPDNPCEKVKHYQEDNQRTRYLSVEEEKLLLSHLTGHRAHVRPIVVLAIHTGMRRGEILNLRWDDVDFEREFLHIPRSKTGPDRYVPMNEVVVGELKQLPTDSEYLFISPATGRPYSKIERAFDAACLDAGIVNLHFHDLRHTCATRLAEKGTDIITIAKFLGHANIQMTQRYAHPTQRNLKQAAKELAEYGQSVAEVLQIKKVG